MPKRHYMLGQFPRRLLLSLSKWAVPPVVIVAAVTTVMFKDVQVTCLHIFVHMPHIQMFFFLSSFLVSLFYPSMATYWFTSVVVLSCFLFSCI